VQAALQRRLLAHAPAGPALGAAAQAAGAPRAVRLRAVAHTAAHRQHMFAYSDVEVAALQRAKLEAHKHRFSSHAAGVATKGDAHARAPRRHHATVSTAGGHLPASRAYTQQLPNAVSSAFCFPFLPTHTMARNKAQHITRNKLKPRSNSNYQTQTLRAGAAQRCSRGRCAHQTAV
jgi:hypothetical protein